MTQLTELIEELTQGLSNNLFFLDEFLVESSKLINYYHNESTENSIATIEKNTFPNRELVETVHYGGILSMESAVDHIMAFRDLLKEPAKTISPWTCIRGALESSALACWFLDPTTDVKERISRSFAFRFYGFKQQIKFLQLDKNAQKEILTVKTRIAEVEHTAINYGYSKVINKNGEIDGIAQRMPEITRLIGIMLGKEGEYRLLSAVTHGQHWALIQMGFKVISVKTPEGRVIKGLEKNLDPRFGLFCTHIVITSIAQVLWNLWRLYGWNIKDLQNLLNSTFDKMRFVKTDQPWFIDYQKQLG